MPGKVTTLARAETQPNGFSQADKDRFIATIQRIGYDPLRTCQLTDIAWSTFYRHYQADEQFRFEVDMAKLMVGEKLRRTSMKVAARAQPETFPDRKLQLQALLPDEYRPDKLLDLSGVGNSITIAYLDGQPNLCRPALPSVAAPLPVVVAQIAEKSESPK